MGGHGPLSNGLNPQSLKHIFGQSGLGHLFPSGMGGPQQGATSGALGPLHFAQGGIVPGVGNQDSVPALLTPGEAVIPKPVVQAATGGAHPFQSGMVNFWSQPSGPNVMPPPPHADTGNQQGLGGPNVGPGPSQPNIDFSPKNQFQFGQQQSQTGTDTPGGRAQQYFGQQGIPFNTLQTNAATNMQSYLGQPTPQQKAFDQFSGQAGQSGLNDQATNRFTQGMTQNGVPGEATNFYNTLLGGQPNLGPGQQAASVLGHIAQTGGNVPGGGAFGNDVQNTISRLMQGGGNGAANPFLQQLLQQNPGDQFAAAYTPQFQKNLDLANLQGSRFGSANALQRGQAVNDFGMLAQQAHQQGVNQQLNAADLMNQAAQANVLNQLQGTGLGLQQGQLNQNAAQMQTQNQLNAAGQLGGFNQQGAIAGLQGQLSGANSLGQFGLQNQQNQLNAAGQLQSGALNNRAQQLQGYGLNGELANNAGNAFLNQQTTGYNMGNQIANQQDQATQRTTNLLLSLLNPAFGASFNVPQQTTPNGATQGAAIGTGIGNTLTAALPYLATQKG